MLKETCNVNLEVYVLISGVQVNIMFLGILFSTYS